MNHFKSIISLSCSRSGFERNVAPRDFRYMRKLAVVCSFLFMSAAQIVMAEVPVSGFPADPPANRVTLGVPFHFSDQGTGIGIAQLEFLVRIGPSTPIYVGASVGARLFRPDVTGSFEVVGIPMTADVLFQLETENAQFHPLIGFSAGALALVPKSAGFFESAQAVSWFAIKPGMKLGPVQFDAALGLLGSSLAVEPSIRWVFEF